jgi:hypothetical protein
MSGKFSHRTEALSNVMDGLGLFKKNSKQTINK